MYLCTAPDFSREMHCGLCVCFQYYNRGGMPSRRLTDDICAVCGQKILVDVEEEGFIEDTYQLSCGHLYP